MLSRRTNKSLKSNLVSLPEPPLVVRCEKKMINLKKYSCSPYLCKMQDSGSARLEWGGLQMPTHKKVGRDQYYKTIKNEVTNSGLDLDKLHVLKIRNRETGESYSNVMTKDKFSKYSPLPAIKKPILVREKTYEVLEPVYVKGPLKEKVKESPKSVKLPEIKRSPPAVKKTKRTPTRSVTSTPKKPQAQQQAVKKEPAVKSAPKKHAFRPQELSKDILPESPTAFWFPI